MCISIYVKYRLWVSAFSETWHFSTGFRKTFKYQVLLKSVQREPSYSLRTDGQTDRQKWWS